jgi:hypothetical protein
MSSQGYDFDKEHADAIREDQIRQMLRYGTGAIWLHPDGRVSAVTHDEMYIKPEAEA